MVLHPTHATHRYLRPQASVVVQVAASDQILGLAVKSREQRVYEISCRYLRNGRIPTPTLINRGLNCVPVKEWERSERALGRGKARTTPRAKMNHLNGRETRARTRALLEFGCYKGEDGRWRLP